MGVSSSPHAETAFLRSWKAEDYVLDRRFCPLEDIRRAVDEYRRSSGASELVVLSIDENVCLRTLSFVSHAGTDLGAALDDALAQHPFRVRDTSAINPAWRRIDAKNLADALQALAEPARYETGVSNPFFTLLADAQREMPWQILGGTFTPRSEIAVNCIAVHRGGSRRHGAAFVRRITVSVNGTANASTHRDRKVTTQVENALDQISELALREPADLLRPLVTMARGVTQSSAAAVYFFDTGDMQHGRLVAVSEDAQPGYALRRRELPQIDIDDRGSVLAAISFVRKRPLLLPEGVANDGQLSSWCYQGRDVPYELAVPIPAAPGGGSMLNAGVIVLCRGTDSPHLAYGNYELALVRNVVLRIALLRTSLMMNEAGKAIASAAHAFAVADAGPGSRRGRNLWYRSRPGAGTGQTSVALPEDLRLALPHLAPIIEFAGRLTASQSVTLRLVIRGGSRRATYSEPRLVRAVAWPSWRLDEEHGELCVADDASVNTWVAKTGLICHLGDISRPTALRGYEGLNSVVRVRGRSTRAELCVPVYVDQRLTGTVNFESTTPNAFALLSDVGQGCAAMVALAIAAVRRRHLRDVLSIGSDVQSSAHDLTGLAERLGQAAKRATSVEEEIRSILKEGKTRIKRGLADRLRGALDRAASVDDEIEDALKTLNEVVPVLRREDSERSIPEDSLQYIVHEAAREAGITSFRHARDALLPGADIAVNWSQRFARRFYLAMFEIFRNVDRHGSLDDSGFPDVFLTQRTLGGRSHVELEIIHGLRPGSRALVSNLYRVPIEANDRLHFGAYTAGAIIRSLGGDVVALRIDANRLLTLVSVPVDKQSAPAAEQGW
jgi:GAF domain-containing protein